MLGFLLWKNHAFSFTLDLHLISKDCNGLAKFCKFSAIVEKFTALRSSIPFIWETQTSPLTILTKHLHLHCHACQGI